MHSLIQLQKATPVFVVTLVCVGLLPTLRAVSPPPDGGYPRGNTAEEQNALLSLNSGIYNTATGTPSATPTCSPGGSPGPWEEVAPVGIDHYGGFMDSDGTFAYEGGGYSFFFSDNINEFGKFDPVANSC